MFDISVKHIFMHQRSSAGIEAKTWLLYSAVWVLNHKRRVEVHAMYRFQQHWLLRVWIDVEGKHKSNKACLWPIM